MNRVDVLSDDLVFRVAELFCTRAGDEELTTAEIADRGNEQFFKGQALKLTRESIYEVISEARARKFLQLVPPPERGLAERVAKTFGHSADQIHVVNVENKESNCFVAAAAAERVYAIVNELARQGGLTREPDPAAPKRRSKTEEEPAGIGLGLGPGRATLDFSRHLGDLFRNSENEVKLRLTAIAAGCPADEPDHAPASYFALYPPSCTTARIGLFAQTLMPCKMFNSERFRGGTGFHEALLEKLSDRIDIIVTSMGDFDDEHDLLRRFMTATDRSKQEHQHVLDTCVGSVQYRPHTTTGPYKERSPSESRAVTLFELEEFVRFASRDGKHVVLIARQCGRCGKVHAEALRPLLTVPKLKVWSEIVMDSLTALQLLEKEGRSPSAEEVARIKQSARVFRTAELFSAGTKATTKEIAESINEEFKGLPRLTRESVYNVIGAARRESFRLVPKLEKTLAQQVAARFRLDPDSIRVVSAEEDASNAAVAARAAEWVFDLATDLMARLRPVWESCNLPEELRGVGLGVCPGRATFDFCKAMGALLEKRDTDLRFRLISIASGSPAFAPDFSSVNFFNLFPRDRVAQLVGLFAETLMSQDDFDREEFRESTGVCEAFAEKFENRIDIIVNSMGDLRDEHDLLRMFLDASGNGSVRELTDRGCVGSVQYRPYTEHGPYKEGREVRRAVTLYELSDFVDLARSKNKHVLLIARRCRQCGRAHAEALRPLLTVRELRVWSEIVMDVPTARELLGKGASRAGAVVGG
jgi:predicted Zn-ribbon and HTH transcriptional regulator